MTSWPALNPKGNERYNFFRQTGEMNKYIISPRKVGLPIVEEAMSRTIPYWLALGWSVDYYEVLGI